jgi:hypothetical protein
MKTRVKEICDQGERLFSKRMPIVSRWQELSEQFYPERADFTATPSLGEDFAGHLMSGYPAMCRRDLANQIGAMLRPRGHNWFNPITTHDWINEDQAAKQWLDYAARVMRVAIYDTKSGFVRATREGDHDFATFGQAVIQVEYNRDLTGLIYRAWHLRDVAWCENAQLEIDVIHRKQKLPARDLIRLFKGKGEISSAVTQAAEKEPYKEFTIHHCIMPADDYDMKAGNRKRMPYVSIYVDMDNQTILEEVPAKRTGYIIPRWQTVSGSQYAHSPATVIAIPDARMLQRMTLTLLEAGEKIVDPPMIAVGEHVSGGINTWAGGVTYVDADYDERTGEVLRPMSTDAKGLQWGTDREMRVQEMINRAFYLNQIHLPDVSGEMTAYETQKRVEEYIRNALPLFEPMEVEYNGALCDTTFEMLLELNAFGNLYEEMPEVLQGQDIRFSFESPLQAAQSRANSAAFQQTAQVLATAAQLDPNIAHVVDLDKATRDAIEGTGAPADWLVPKDKADQAKQQAAAAQAQQAQDAEMMGQLGAGADIAQKAGGAMHAINEAMMGAA